MLTNRNGKWYFLNPIILFIAIEPSPPTHFHPVPNVFKTEIKNTQ